MVTQTVRLDPTSSKQETVRPDLSNRYTLESELYQLKGGFVAEVIQSPTNKMRQSGTYYKAFRELQLVTMKAFEKSLKTAHIYAPKKVVEKNVLNVDWLIVVRKQNRPVGYSSASYLSPFLVCLNSAIVDANFQAAGVGFVCGALLLKLINEKATDLGLLPLDYVCRTHNRNVASIMQQVLKGSVFSTEKNLSNEFKDNFTKMTKYLDCHYDEINGISKNVYPIGLPTGTKVSNPRINDVFKNVGDRDAVYITGQLNASRIEKLLQRNIIDRSSKEIVILHNENSKAVCA